MSDRFISYAQNFEDVMLWRALKNFSPGIYVDVGANDPVTDSVTKAFYDRGWRGINIEAEAEFCQKLRQARPKDKNLQVFAGATEGSTSFFQIGNTGLSTAREDFADMHRESGHDVQKVTVTTKTLASILAESKVENDSFHFLKIDAEGAEPEVLKGMDLETYRPWLLVVESTEPNSTEPTHHEFENLILPFRYRSVYFDGLSRFYVAEERSELEEMFLTPPNVHDHFVLWEELKAKKAREETTASLLRLETRCVQLEDRCTMLEKRRKRLMKLLRGLLKDTRKSLKDLKKASTGLYCSSRWKWGGRLTRPFSRQRKSGDGRLDKAIASLAKSIQKIESEELDNLSGNLNASQQLGENAGIIAEVIGSRLIEDQTSARSQ